MPAFLVLFELFPKLMMTEMAVLLFRYLAKMFPLVVFLEGAPYLLNWYRHHNVQNQVFEIKLD
ncbi:hypothetical protein DPMN_161660 [Dreissena polymorpha]|uniref:Uncharacterized protein n=1 Tax=Dreissena polymorpha TaxID=45954 RepID=A0A9D4ENV7_DREPO|nr:hypothetical protein DPMN_161660 [Dreissena polymorpha]